MTPRQAELYLAQHLELAARILRQDDPELPTKQMAENFARIFTAKIWQIVSTIKE